MSVQHRKDQTEGQHCKCEFQDTNMRNLEEHVAAEQVTIEHLHRDGDTFQEYDVDSNSNNSDS